MPETEYSTAAAAQQRSFLKGLERLSFTAGKVLFLEGDPGGPMMVLLSGAVTLTRLTDAAEELHLGVVKPGQILGELSMFDAGQRSATAQATQDTTVALLGRDQLMQLLAHKDPVARALVQACTQVVVTRLRRTRDLTRLLRSHLGGAPDSKLDRHIQRLLEEREPPTFPGLAVEGEPT